MLFSLAQLQENWGLPWLFHDDWVWTAAGLTRMASTLEGGWRPVLATSFPLWPFLLFMSSMSPHGFHPRLGLLQSAHYPLYIFHLITRKTSKRLGGKWTFYPHFELFSLQAATHSCGPMVVMKLPTLLSESGTIRSKHLTIKTADVHMKNRLVEVERWWVVQTCKSKPGEMQWQLFIWFTIVEDLPQNKSLDSFKHIVCL